MQCLFTHDVVEVVGGHCRVSIRVSPVNHFLDLFVRHGLAELTSYTPEVADGNCASTIVIEKAKHFVDVLAGVVVAHAGLRRKSHHRFQRLRIMQTNPQASLGLDHQP